MVVFLCSTYADLASEREAVLGVIQELKHQNQAMESFGARPNRAIDTCLEEVRSSDVLIVVIGFLYGSIAPASEISYTEAEYKEGYANGKTCFVYLRDEDAVIPARHAERDPAKLARLAQFRELLQGRHTVVKFHAAADLARQVGLDLTRLAEKNKDQNAPEADVAQDPHERFARELEVAAQVQRELLPHAAPPYEGIDIASSWVPSRYVGGDYYDFLPYADGRLGLAIADVAGKSIPAALIMTALQARVNILAEFGLEPAELMARLNQSMSRNISSRYVTMCIALLDTQTGDFGYCNAGHVAPLIARKDGSVERLTGMGGMPVGLFPSGSYEGETAHLQPGDALLLYTDGVSERFDSAGDEFGQDRLGTVLRENRASTAQDIVQAIVKASLDWEAAEVPNDDLTLVVVRRV